MATGDRRCQAEGRIRHGPQRQRRSACGAPPRPLASGTRRTCYRVHLKEADGGGLDGWRPQERPPHSHRNEARPATTDVTLDTA